MVVEPLVRRQLHRAEEDLVLGQEPVRRLIGTRQLGGGHPRLRRPDVNGDPERVEEQVRGIGRAQVVSADFFAGPLPEADVITMGMVLHDWNLARKLRLIGVPGHGRARDHGRGRRRAQAGARYWRAKRPVRRTCRWCR